MKVQLLLLAAGAAQTQASTQLSVAVIPADPNWNPVTCTIESESQCDGQNWSQSKCCKDPAYLCQLDTVQNVKRCMKPIAGVAPAPAPVPAPASGTAGPVALWGQCGGDGWGVGCVAGTICVRQSKWYAQCMPSSLPLDTLCAQNDPQGQIVWDFGGHCAAGTACQSVNWKDSRCRAVPPPAGGAGGAAFPIGDVSRGYPITNDPSFYAPTPSPIDPNAVAPAPAGGVAPNPAGSTPYRGGSLDLVFLRGILHAIKDEIKREIDQVRQEFYSYLNGNGAPVFVPGKAALPLNCKEVSVEGDATYCVQEPLCSGSGDQPVGTACPAKGMTAVASCWSYLKSYNPATGQCTAPVNAKCQRIKTGAWGCVWSGGDSDVAPPPKPASDCTKVSVVGDATYCIKGPVCSGNGAQPTGTMCPVQNDMAIESCYGYLNSYSGEKKQCIAPRDAVCQRIPSGAWGCVWSDGKAAKDVVPAPVPAGHANTWEQCFGKGYSEQCKSPNTCVVFSPYYGQCLPQVLDWDGLCGQNDGKEIKWMYDHCPIGTSCQPVGPMDFRCRSGFAAPTSVPAGPPVLPPPTKASSACTQVSVEGDATYCVPSSPCVGTGATASGTTCPKQGDEAVGDCHISLNSFTGTGKCVAPVDAVCQKIKTGAWGCAFPTNVTPHPTEPPPKKVYAQVWEQCGATDWSKECFGATKCITQSKYYSQCMPWLLDAGQLCGQSDGKDLSWKFDACRSTSCLPFNAVDMRCQ